MENLVKRLRALVILDEVRSNNPLARDAADRIEELETALIFYADPTNWESPSTGFNLQYEPEPSPFQKDRGAIARSVLRKSVS